LSGGRFQRSRVLGGCGCSETTRERTGLCRTQPTASLKTDDWQLSSARGTSETPRHTWLTRYRCSLPGLAGFAGPRCTKPEVPRLGSWEIPTARKVYHRVLRQDEPRAMASRPGLCPSLCLLPRGVACTARKALCHLRFDGRRVFPVTITPCNFVSADSKGVGP